MHIRRSSGSTPRSSRAREEPQCDQLRGHDREQDPGGEPGTHERDAAGRDAVHPGHAPRIATICAPHEHDEIDHRRDEHHARHRRERDEREQREPLQATAGREQERGRREEEHTP